MHSLDRKATSAPGCLAAYDYHTQTWDDAAPCKPAIRERLAVVQVERCAYCETPLFGGGHIEHFRRKNRAHFPELTFAWSNLFLSCDSPSNCGRFKDRRNAPAYDPKQLVKPDEDDPEVFLYFHSDGEVRPQSGADPAAEARANETIRVFGLNDPALKDSRRRALNRYLRDAHFDDVLSSLLDGEKREYVESELLDTEAIAFRTTVHHFLKKYL
jgi:uncharacterized protein (TIGR02646 family)